MIGKSHMRPGTGYLARQEAAEARRKRHELPPEVAAERRRMEMERIEAEDRAIAERQTNPTSNPVADVMLTLAGLPTDRYRHILRVLSGRPNWGAIEAAIREEHTRLTNGLSSPFLAAIAAKTEPEASSPAAKPAKSRK